MEDELIHALQVNADARGSGSVVEIGVRPAQNVRVFFL
jgi:hypothetical protein